MPRKVDSKTLDEQVIAGGRNALVLFYGDWCSDCKAFKPLWNRWTKGKRGSIFELEVGRGSKEWREWDLKEIPTVALFIEGAEDDRADGTIQKKHLDVLWTKLKSEE